MKKIIYFLTLTSFALCGSDIRGQPFKDEVITQEMLVDGKTPQVPLEIKNAILNWSSRGAGCCVVASTSTALKYQTGKTDATEEMKRVSLTDMGGHDPDKLERQLREVMKKHPELKWFQWYDGNWEKVREWTSKGYPVSMTWGAGKRYPGPIAHFVNCIHVDDKFAMIKDCNFEEYSIVPEPEGKRRFLLNMGGWGFVWTHALPPTDPNKVLEDFDINLLAIFLCGCYCITLLVVYRVTNNESVYEF